MSLNKNEQPDYLVFDASNILYRTFYAYKGEDDQTLAGLAHHSALMMINKYYKQYKPKKKIVLCFDRPNWRKIYTQSDSCVSSKVYKAQRAKKRTPSEKEKFEKFLQHISEFEQLMRDHTTTIVLAQEELEADDLIALFTFTFPNDKIHIISSDKDLIQLITPNVTLIDPISQKPRSLSEWDGDSKLFLFEKCFRGDLGDNIQSAYPRLRKTKIRQAYTDDYVFNNLMQHEWTDAHGTTFKVKDLFDENRMLVDLSAQPEEIKRKGVTHILTEMNKEQQFSYFHFLQFCGKNDLKRVSERIDDFIPLLSL